MFTIVRPVWLINEHSRSEIVCGLWIAWRVFRSDDGVLYSPGNTKRVG